MTTETCVYCNQTQDHENHDRRNVRGWHDFRGLTYVMALEDALLFAREQNVAHVWEYTGITIDTGEPFEEKYCTVCGTRNWGGKESGVCFGSNQAEFAIISAHNRRAGELMRKRK